MYVLWSLSLKIHNYASLLKQPEIPNNMVMLIGISSRKTGQEIEDLYQNNCYFYAELSSN